MSTVDDVLQTQKSEGILSAPSAPSETSPSTSSTFSTSTTSTSSSSAKASHTPSTASSGTPPTMQIALRNNTTSQNVYAYVTGLAIDNDYAVYMLQADGQTAYYPTNPSADNTPVPTDCAIEVGRPGSTTTITIPHLAGARIWFSQDAKLTFLLNRGTRSPGLVEPAVTNTADPNYALRWDFVEFTYNDFQLFANVTYVDFISIPTALKLTTTDGSPTQTVAGIPEDGLATIAADLQAQQKVDCAGWDQLVVQVKSAAAGTSVLRVLAPDKGSVITPGLFDGYYDDYLAQVWAKYRTDTLTINTQGSWGNVRAQVNANGDLDFGDAGVIAKPSTADIFNCSSGAFDASKLTTDELLNLGARLAAALNRSTLLATAEQPNGAPDASAYYQTSCTNHYSRIVHAANLDGRGYTFPYDDVAADGAADQAGAVFSSFPDTMTVYIGGGDDAGAASSPAKARHEPVRLRDMARPGRQLVGGRLQHARRALPSPLADCDEKVLLEAHDRSITDADAGDLEKGYAVATKEGASAAPAAPAAPDLAARFAVLLHQALVALWAAIAGLAQSAWALVPRRVAGPVGAFCTRAAASPAVAAMSKSATQLATSVLRSAAASVVAAMIVRPLLVRACLTLAVLGVTYAAGVGATAPPALLSALTAISTWAESLVCEQ